MTALPFWADKALQDASDTIRSIYSGSDAGTCDPESIDGWAPNFDAMVWWVIEQITKDVYRGPMEEPFVKEGGLYRWVPGLFEVRTYELLGADRFELHVARRARDLFMAHPGSPEVSGARKYSFDIVGPGGILRS